MQTWMTGSQTVKTWMNNKLGNISRAVQDFTGGLAKKTVAEAKSVLNNGSSVVGINVNAIEGMKTEIREYVNKINAELAELKNYDPEVAFKGEAVVPALKQYIDAVIESCSAITSYMLAFNDQLSEVKAAYEDKDKVAGSTITKSAGSTRSAYTKYTENGSSVQ